jgi:hypothetical protein
MLRGKEKGRGARTAAHPVDGVAASNVRRVL